MGAGCGGAAAEAAAAHGSTVLPDVDLVSAAVAEHAVHAPGDASPEAVFIAAAENAMAELLQVCAISVFCDAD